jgi:hypothetical protein
MNDDKFNDLLLTDRTPELLSSSKKRRLIIIIINEKEIKRCKTTYNYHMKDEEVKNGE